MSQQKPDQSAMASAAVFQQFLLAANQLVAAKKKSTRGRKKCNFEGVFM